LVMTLAEQTGWFTPDASSASKALARPLRKGECCGWWLTLCTLCGMF